VLYSPKTRSQLKARLDALDKDVRAQLAERGFEGEHVRSERILNMRFDGTDTALMVLPDADDGDGNEDFEAAFRRVYKAEFGFLLDTKGIVVDDIKVRGLGKTFDKLPESVFVEVERLQRQSIDKAKANSTYSVFFDGIGRVEDTPVFLLDRLEKGDEVEGPAMIIDNTQTIVLIPGAKALLTSGHLFVTLEDENNG
jgi:5-oxoprolinase (ATP-hydrolysing)